MADPIISASTQVDLAGIQGLKAELAVLQEKYRSVSSDIKQSVNRVVDAEKQATDAIAAGHKQLATVMQSAAETERTALSSLIAQQDLVGASMLELKAAITPATLAEEENTVATEAMAGAHGHAVSQIQATSGALRTLEGTGGIRAAERFLTLIPGIGTALQTAFPIVGAIALAEVLERMITHFTKTSEEEKKAAEEAKHFAEETRQAARELESLDLQLAKIQGGSVAGASQAVRNATENLTAAIKEAKEENDKLHGGSVQNVSGRQVIVPPHPSSDTVTAAAEAAIKAGEKELEARKKLQIAIASLNKAEEEERKKQAEEAKRAAREQATAAKQAQEAVKKAYDDQLDDLKLTQNVTKEQELAFRQKELADTRIHGDQLLSIKRQIITLENEIDKQEEESGKKRVESVAKSGEAIIRQHEKEEKEAERNAKYWAKYFDELDARAEESAKKRIEQAQQLAQLKNEDQGVKDTGADELAKLGIERQYALSLDNSAQAAVRRAQAERAADAQIYADKVKEAQINVTLAKDENDRAKAQIALDKVLSAARNKDYQDETKVLVARQAQYKKFFDQINQEGTKAFNDLLTNGPRKFVQDLNQIWTKMVLDFADKLLVMGIKWVENEVLMLVAHTASQQAQVAATAAAATQTAAINATTTLAKITQDAVKAATGAYSAVVGIPIVGPILAPIAAGVAFAGVEAFGALASFETGTNYVPQTGMYQLHAGEAVVPKQYNPAAGGSGGGPMNVTQNIYGAPSHSPQQVADMAVGKLQGLMRRQNARIA